MTIKKYEIIKKPLFNNSGMTYSHAEEMQLDTNFLSYMAGYIF